MNKSKPTPGPWNLNEQRSLPSIKVGEIGYITVNCGSDNRANARLIAAAPCMASAIRDYLVAEPFSEEAKSARKSLQLVLEKAGV